MALTHHFDPLFGVVPVAKARRQRKAQADTGADPDSVLACEFSNLGRDPRFPSGWYILPALALGLLILGFLLA